LAWKNVIIYQSHSSAVTENGFLIRLVLGVASTPAEKLLLKM
jgi:hypothetical protein